MNTWTVHLIEEATGAPLDTTFAARWSPDKVSTEEIAKASAAQESWLRKKKYLPISAAFKEASVV